MLKGIFQRKLMYIFIDIYYINVVSFRSPSKNILPTLLGRSQPCMSHWKFQAKLDYPECFLAQLHC